jgi:hypothetical protein
MWALWRMWGVCGVCGVGYVGYVFPRTLIFSTMSHIPHQLVKHHELSALRIIWMIQTILYYNKINEENI